MDKNLNNQLVSIILPAYNVSLYIRDAIFSVLNQTYYNFELIIIDDGSTDNTLSIVNQIQDSRIKIIRNPINLGIQKTLNNGLRLSQGIYIARIDGDDEWIDKDKLKKQIQFLEENKECILIGSGAVCINEDGKYLYKYLKPQTDKMIRGKIIGQNCFIHSSIVFRKKEIISLGGYSEDEKTKHAEDYDLWLKAGKIGKFYNIPEYSVKFMIRKSSIGNTNFINQLKKTTKIAKEYKKYYPKNKNLNMLRNYARLIFYGYIKRIIK